MDYQTFDPELWQAIEKETNRQQNNLELIASENIVSEGVMAAQGSILTNKYAEGYPGRRYYGGCEFVDVVENLAIERAKSIFGGICQCSTAFWFSSQHSSLFSVDRNRRYSIRDGSFRRRSFDSWLTSEFQRQDL